METKRLIRILRLLYRGLTLITKGLLVEITALEREAKEAESITTE
jgi:hypothetical protein